MNHNHYSTESQETQTISGEFTNLIRKEQQDGGMNSINLNSDPDDITPQQQFIEKNQHIHIPLNVVGEEDEKLQFSDRLGQQTIEVQQSILSRIKPTNRRYSSQFLEVPLQIRRQSADLQDFQKSPIKELGETEEDGEKQAQIDQDMMKKNLQLNLRIQRMLRNNTVKSPEVDEFTLTDLKILEETIQQRKKNVENELSQMRQQKSLQRTITIKPKTAQKWEKAKNALLAYTRMKRIFGDIKSYGTSVQGLNVGEDVFQSAKQMMLKRNPSLYKKNQVYIFYQNSQFLYFWSLCSFFITRLIWYIGPFQFFFDDGEADYQDQIYIFFQFIDALLLLDTILDLNSSFINKSGVQIKDRNQILRRHSKWILFDIATVFPFQLIFDRDNIQKIQILPRNINIFFKYIRTFRMVKKSKIKFLDIVKIRSSSLRLVQFFFMILNYVNIAACLWYYIARLNDFDDYTWVSYLRNLRKDKNSLDKFDLYTASLYWAFQTLFSIGFGDIFAQNLSKNKNQTQLISFYLVQRLVSILWMIMGAGFFSYAIGSISNLIAEGDSKQY